MNVQTIEESAGLIKNLLQGENRKWEYREIKDATKLRDREFNSAIGWLACEEKIQFESTTVEKEELLYIESNYYIG